MNRIACWLWFAPMLLALLFATGCSQSPEPYLQLFEEQRVAWNEMADILETIEDDKTMEAARGKLKERVSRFELIAARGRDLPKPSDGVRRQLEENRFLYEAATRRIGVQIARIRALNLKGAPEFFRTFESGNQSLLNAVQP